MRVRSASKAILGGMAAMSFGVGALEAGPPPPSLRFETVFGAGGAPARFHAQVLYRTGEAVHRMSLWREGDRLLRRDTDAMLTSVIAHKPGDPAYRIDLFDHRRRIHAVIDRDSLYHIGRFTDWDELTKGLRHPAGAYRLQAVRAVRTAAPLAAPCDWYKLTDQHGSTQICWSAAMHFPVQMLDGNGRLVWRTKSLDTRGARAETFRPRFPGYVFNDARREISGD